MSLAKDSSRLKVLITRTDRIGDLILTTPVFKSLREKYPDAYIGALVDKRLSQVIDGNPYLNEVVPYDRSGAEKSALGTLRFALRLRKANWNIAVNLHPTNRMHWVTFLAGIKRRIGYSRKCSWLMTETIADDKEFGAKHEALLNYDLLRFLDVATPKDENQLCLHLPLNKELRDSFLQVTRQAGLDVQGEPYVVLNPSSSCPSRRWHAERFAELGDRLNQNYGFRTVLIGAKEHSELADRVAEKMRINPVNLAGKLSLGELTHLVNAANLLVSNDTGPVHVAAACDTAVLALFGRNRVGLGPERWRPLGSKSRYMQKDVGCFDCLAHNCKIDFLCMEVLSVDEVMHELKQMESCFLKRKGVEP